MINQKEKLASLKISLLKNELSWHLLPEAKRVLTDPLHFPLFIPLLKVIPLQISHSTLLSLHCCLSLPLNLNYLCTCCFLFQLRDNQDTTEQSYEDILAPALLVVTLEQV